MSCRLVSCNSAGARVAKLVLTLLGPALKATWQYNQAHRTLLEGWILSSQHALSLLTHSVSICNPCRMDPSVSICPFSLWILVSQTLPLLANALCACVLQFNWGEGGINTVRALYFSTASQLGLTPSAFAGRVPSLVVSP